MFVDARLLTCPACIDHARTEVIIRKKVIEHFNFAKGTDKKEVVIIKNLVFTDELLVWAKKNLEAFWECYARYEADFTNATDSNPPKITLNFIFEFVSEQDAMLFRLSWL